MEKRAPAVRVTCALAVARPDGGMRPMKFETRTSFKIDDLHSTRCTNRFNGGGEFRRVRRTHSALLAMRLWASAARTIFDALKLLLQRSAFPFLFARRRAGDAIRLMTPLNFCMNSSSRGKCFTRGAAANAKPQNISLATRHIAQYFSLVSGRQPVIERLLLASSRPR